MREERWRKKKRKEAEIGEEADSLATRRYPRQPPGQTKTSLSSTCWSFIKIALIYNDLFLYSHRLIFQFFYMQ